MILCTTVILSPSTFSFILIKLFSGPGPDVKHCVLLLILGHGLEDL